MTCIKVRYASEDSLSALRNSKKLCVHSVFEQGVNLQGDEGLIFVSDKPLPFSLMIDHKEVNKLNKIFSNANLLYVEPNLYIRSGKDLLTLDLTNVEILSFEVHPVSDLEYLDVLFDMILDLSELTGLDQSIADVLIQDYSSEYLLGRGKGLTPSGDDMIVGILWVLAISGIEAAIFKDSIRNMLGKGKTTTVSENYLRYALENKFSKALGNLLYDPKELAKQMEELLKTGHTSGLDTLCGIAIGIKMIKEKRMQ